MGLEVLVPRGGVLTPRDTIRIPFTIKLWLPLSHLELLVIVEKKGATIVSGVIELEYHEDVGLLLQNGEEI